MSFGYQSSRLLNHIIFSSEELEFLHNIGNSFSLSQLIKHPRWMEESAIDFVFTSSQIEGNTYTRADTISLLKLGKTAGDKRYSEAVMIMNLRAAYDYILHHSHKVLTHHLEECATYHSIIMRGLLSDSNLGSSRQTAGIKIGGSEYQPLSGKKQLNREISILFSEMNKIHDTFDQSLYAAANLAYLQYFEDGNKRTSRLFQNAILMAHNLPPVLFPVRMIQDYLEATLNYYEYGDYLLHRRFMMDAYGAVV